MQYILIPGAGPPLRVHSRCEDELLAKAELLLFAEDAQLQFPGRLVVGTYEVEPRLTIGELKRAYRYDRPGYNRLLRFRGQILSQGWTYPQWVDPAE
jgi:hypothetical protein